MARHGRVKKPGVARRHHRRRRDGRRRWRCACSIAAFASSSATSMPARVARSSRSGRRSRDSAADVARAADCRAHGGRRCGADRRRAVRSRAGVGGGRCASRAQVAVVVDVQHCRAALRADAALAPCRARHRARRCADLRRPGARAQRNAVDDDRRATMRRSRASRRCSKRSPRIVFTSGKRAGDGSAMKIVNNMLAGINLAAAGEALALAERLGMDLESVRDRWSRRARADRGCSPIACRALIAGDYLPPQRRVEDPDEGRRPRDRRGGAAARSTQRSRARRIRCSPARWRKASAMPTTPPSSSTTRRDASALKSD